MTTAVKSQLFGIALAFGTAIGCLAYEKIVKNLSFGVIVFLALLFYVPALAIMAYHDSVVLSTDLKRLFTEKTLIWAGIVYILTWCTTPLWYIITKKQGVMTGSLYEVKYIAILALIYIIFGDRSWTWNTTIGIVLAMSSIYFISKT